MPMGRKKSWAVGAAMLLMCIVAVGTRAADQPVAHVALAGHRGAIVLDATGEQTAVIGEQRDVSAIAIDDRRGLLWLVTRGGSLRAYDFSGVLKVDVKLPGRIHDGQPESRSNDEHDESGEDNQNDTRLPADFHSAALAVDKRDGSVWIGVDSALLKYSGAGAFLLGVPIAHHVGRLSFDWAKGLLWLVADDAITAHDATGQTILTLALNTAHGHPNVASIGFDDRLAALWVAQQDEVDLYDRDGEQIAQFMVQDPDFLAADGRGNVWIANQDGLARYDRHGVANLRPVLPDKHVDVRGLAVDQNDGTLWMVTHDSVMKVDANGIVSAVLDGHASNGPEQNGSPGDADDVLHHLEFITANGDINAPTAAITDPAGDSLVRPRPTIKLNTDDIGLGVNPAYTTLKVDGADAAVTCTGDANGEQCVPDAPLTADPVTLTLGVSDYAGNRSEPISVTVLLDTDGDGHDDNHDTYPNDPTRYRLTAVGGVKVALQDDHARLDWQPEADTANTAGYFVYRTQAGQTTEIKLTASPLDAVHYVDAAVANGTGYSYRVVAVDRKGNLGEPGTPTNFFVAYNHTPITGLKAARVKVAGRLVWDEAAGFRYHVYRSEKGESVAPLAETDAAGYLDPTPLWYKTYEYQVATIADFTDPFTHKPVHVEGPLSNQVELPPLPPLTMQLNDGVPGADGVPELLIRGATVAVSGTYQQAVGPVDVIAAAGDRKVVSTADNGTFRLVLPGVADATWTITISEQTVADRDVQTQLRLIKDTEPPTVTLDGTIATTTSDDTITLSGTAKDSLTGVAELYAASDRATGQKFALIQGANDNWYGDVPLDIGANHFTVYATDGVGNTASAGITITRRAPLAPHLVIASPANGATVTQDSVTVSGTVYTGLDAKQVRISLNGVTQFPTSGDSVNGYPFTFNNVRLNSGYNALTVTVDTPVGSTNATVAVNYQTAPPPPKETPPPSLDITSPTTETTVNGDSTTITGNAGDGATVTVNGDTVTTDPDGNFQYNVDLSNCIAGTQTVTIVATDTDGRTTTRTIVLTCDRLAPVITLDASLQAPPAVNKVYSNPYTLSGTVSDANLGGFTINGQNVSLTPVSPGSYGFSAALKLPPGRQTPVDLIAWDGANNLTSRSAVLEATAPAALQLVAPRDGAQLSVSGKTTKINVVVRASGQNTNGTITAAFDGGQPVTLTRDGDSASGDVTASATDGDHTLKLSLTDASGQIVTSGVAHVTFVNTDNVTLAVAAHEPASDAHGIEPNQFIKLNFNKAIDPAKLQVSLKETVHGMTYDLSQMGSAGVGAARVPPLVRVDRDQEAVPAGLSFFPGGRMVAVYPHRDFAYGAAVFVDVSYDGQPISRFNFAIRSLPTFLQGVVVDQFSNPVSGLEVQMPKFGLTATTDQNGSFGFGFGLPADKSLPAGRFHVVFNPGMKRHDLGTLDKWANLEEGRLNRMGVIKLPLLDPQAPFNHIQGGNSSTLLASGDLALDLGDANLLFPDGRNAGDVQAQFIGLENIPYPVYPGAIPQWIFGIQPAGIGISGAVGIAIKMPALYGGYAYVPADGTLVVLIGLDPQTQQIVPVGVGRIADRRVTSIGKVNLQTLDYIGYAFVVSDLQPLLQRYVDHEIDLSQLTSALEPSQ